MLNKILLNEKGSSPAGRFFWVAVIAVAVYALILLGPMYFTMQMLLHEVRNEAKIAYHYPDEVVVERVMKKAKDWKISLRPENVQVIRGNPDNTVIVTYSVHKKFIPKKWEHTFHFVLTASRPNTGPKL